MAFGINDSPTNYNNLMGNLGNLQLPWQLNTNLFQSGGNFQQPWQLNTNLYRGSNNQQATGTQNQSGWETSDYLQASGIGLLGRGLIGSIATKTQPVSADLGGLRNFEKTLERKIQGLEDKTFSTADPTLQRAFGQLESQAQQGMEETQRNISMRGLSQSGLSGALERQQQFDVARQRGDLTARRLSQEERLNEQQIQNLLGRLGQTKGQIAQMELQQRLAEQQADRQRQGALFSTLANLGGSLLTMGLFSGGGG